MVVHTQNEKLAKLRKGVIGLYIPITRWTA